MAISLSTSATTLSRLISFTTSTTPKPSFTSFKPSLSLSLSFPKPLSLSPLKPVHFSTSSSNRSTPITATITPGTPLPDSTFSYLNSSNDVLTVSTKTLTSSKTTILFAVPGAFTPTCSQKHVPSFLALASELKSKGVSTIACISINDAFVMKAWKESLVSDPTDDSVMFLSDINGEFTKAIGAELDLSDKPVGLGVRSRRYAMIVVDGVVKVVHMEEGGAFTFSGAEDMLKEL